MRSRSYYFGLLLALGGTFAAAGGDYRDYLPQAIDIMEHAPLVDGHVDLPFIIKSLGQYPLESIREHNETMPGHMDLKRMRQGRLGALFMVAWTPCPPSHIDTEPLEYIDTGEGVRDTLEAIDIINEIVATSPNDFALVSNSADIVKAANEGKIGTLIGVEGGHQLGNSLSVVRLYAQLGVRYITLTHTCHNVFASSAGSGTPLKGVYPGDGLTDLGYALVEEMNRLGILVDLSHTSAQTMRDTIRATRAPVMFSHSGARAVLDHPRNVPDDVLAMIGDGADQVDGIVMAVFYPKFVDPNNPTIQRVADHIEHIAKISGKKHVGIGSDFDGMDSAVVGLEDASKYPNLIAELIMRGWTDSDIEGLLGGNLMRILDGADKTKEEMSTMPASSAVLMTRPDLPCTWGGPLGQYLPRDVKDYLRRTVHDHSHDEL